MTRDLTSPASDPDELTITEVEPETAEMEPDEPADGEIDPSRLDPDAVKVVRRLLHQGHQAYFVGGCVRDLLVGKEPKDFDVATSAHPGEVRAIFRNCRLIGRRFRLAHVYFKGGKVIEVSTFRANPAELRAAGAELAAADPEGEQVLPEVEEPRADEAPNEAPLVETESSQAAEGSRAALTGPTSAEEDLLITHDNVFGTVDQDARRRDFTINGLFYDVEAGQVVDYVRGRRDLALRFIRTIGDPEVRMREDPVRILRAVRFACKLDFDFEPRTYAAMEGAVEDLPRCAPARLLEETFKLIRGGVATPAIKLLAALDALKLLLPPIDQFLREHPNDGQSAFYAYTEALDRRVRAGKGLDDAILLAVLLYPLGRKAPPEPQETAVVEAGGSNEEPAAVASESSEESAEESIEASTEPAGAEVAEAAPPSAPTAPAEIEELLATLVQTARLPRRIAERCKGLLWAQRTLSGERRRRGSLASFRRHPLFFEALTVFECVVEASGQYDEQLRAWKEGGAPQSASGGSSGRRRRRRRRGGGGASAGSSAPADVPAND